MVIITKNAELYQNGKIFAVSEEWETYLDSDGITKIDILIREISRVEIFTKEQELEDKIADLEARLKIQEEK